MVSRNADKGPRETVTQFWNYLGERQLESAYGLLTSAEKAAVPAGEWKGPSWDSPDDQIYDQITELSFGEAAQIRAGEAQVPVSITFKNETQIQFTYRTFLQEDGWHIYLGLDRGMSPEPR